MKKLIFALSVCSFLMGCSTRSVVETEYVEVPVPVYTVPMPPKLTKPDFFNGEIPQEIRASDDAEEVKEYLGELAKIYRVNLNRLRRYAEAADLVIETYREIATYGEDRLGKNIKIDDYLGDESLNPYTYRSNLPFGGSEITEAHWDWDLKQWKAHFDARERFNDIEEKLSEKDDEQED